MSSHRMALRDREVFDRRCSEYEQSFGRYAAFALAAAQGSMEKILCLGEEGRQVVATRDGGYRHFDPETIGVDSVAEGYFLQRLKDSDFGAVVISEEAGRLTFTSGKEKVFAVSDPFDGSLLYKRGVPAFWYTTLALYSEGGEPLAAAVCDVPHQTVDFANQERAFGARFHEGKLVGVAKLSPVETELIEDAILETYMMKVPRMYPASQIWKPLLSQVKFILPNGGPAGYADVAKGSVDIYLALEEAHIENFSALPIAWKAGAVVTDFDGDPVKFEDKKDKRYFILCTANESLHEKVLKEIAGIDWKNHPHYQQILQENADLQEAQE